MKKLLIDTILFNPTKVQLNEAMTKDGRMIVRGILQRADAENQNGRIYPKNLLLREIKKYIGREIAENRAYGELDHPESSIIEFKNVSHIIREIYWDGNDVIGKIEILDTPSGRILMSILKAGGATGISSRGMGSVTESDGGRTVTVEEDFDLIGWDFVTNPSTQKAFPVEVKESINESVKRKIIQNKYSAIDTIVRDIICEANGACKL